MNRIWNAAGWHWVQLRLSLPLEPRCVSVKLSFLNHFSSFRFTFLWSAKSLDQESVCLTDEQTQTDWGFSVCLNMARCACRVWRDNKQSSGMRVCFSFDCTSSLQLFYLCTLLVLNLLPNLFILSLNIFRFLFTLLDGVSGSERVFLGMKVFCLLIFSALKSSSAGPVCFLLLEESK